MQYNITNYGLFKEIIHCQITVHNDIKSVIYLSICFVLLPCGFQIDDLNLRRGVLSWINTSLIQSQLKAFLIAPDFAETHFSWRYFSNIFCKTTLGHRGLKLIRSVRGHYGYRFMSFKQTINLSITSIKKSATLFCSEQLNQLLNWNESRDFVFHFDMNPD